MVTSKDLLLEEIRKFKSKLGDKNLTTKIVEALREDEVNVTNLTSRKQALPKKKN